MNSLTTIYDIVDLVVEKLPDDNLQKIAETPEEDLILLHFSLGAWIRNQWLWNLRGSHLVEGKHPDDVSMEIIRLVWMKLRTRQGTERLP